MNEINTMIIQSHLLARSATTSLFDMRRRKGVIANLDTWILYDKVQDLAPVWLPKCKKYKDTQSTE